MMGGYFLMLHSHKKTIIKLTIFSAIILIFLYFTNNIYQEKNNFQKQYFQIVDTEEIGNPTYLTNLYNQSDLLIRLNNFKDEMKNNSNFTYIEFSPVTLQFIGAWDKPLHLIENEVTVNQRIPFKDKEIEVTSIEGMMLDETCIELYSLALESGELFTANDFIQMNNELPLILGHDFKEYYSIGDTIPLLYYGQEWIGTVKGFLKENQEIVQDSMIYPLDTKLLVPSFTETNLVNGFDETYQQMIMHSKLQGYVLLENKEEYKAAKKEVETISKKYHLSYELLKGY